MSSNNLIFFPSNLSTEPRFIAPTEEIARLAKENYINQMINHYAEYVATQLSMHGVDIDSSDFERHYALSIECMRSAVYKSFKLSHPLQDPMEDMIRVIEECEQNNS
jgi:hypothetical protein